MKINHRIWMGKKTEMKWNKQWLRGWDGYGWLGVYVCVCDCDCSVFECITEIEKSIDLLFRFTRPMGKAFCTIPRAIININYGFSLFCVCVCLFGQLEPLLFHSDGWMDGWMDVLDNIVEYSRIQCYHTGL